MRFEKITPIDKLQPYIKYLVISEAQEEQQYKVFPSTALVMGFQYKGKLLICNAEDTNPLATAGITGLQNTFKVFKNTSNVGSILVYFTEVGISYFTDCPVNELFNQSIALDYLFDKNKVAETEDRLANALTDAARIKIVEKFLLNEIKEKKEDLLIVEALKLIYASKGTIKIQEINEKLAISQSPFEKRFRRLIGTSPKKFASIVRFYAVLDDLNTPKTLTEIAYENNFFDQAHFIKDFKVFTGESPENFKKHS